MAVDDIKVVQENAVLSRLAMQVSLNLDVEKVLPDFLKRRFFIREESVYPNKSRNIFSKFLKDDSTLQRISKAVVAGGNESEISQLSTRLEDVVNKMRALKEQIKQMSDDQITSSRILQSIAKQQGISLEMDDNDD